MSGNLRERVPVLGLDHPFDNLPQSQTECSTNRVLVTEMAGVGNENSARSRTPLTSRETSALNRSRQRQDPEEIAIRHGPGDWRPRSIVDCHNALLRITEIGTARQVSFAKVALRTSCGNRDLYDRSRKTSTYVAVAPR